MMCASFEIIAINESMKKVLHIFLLVEKSCTSFNLYENRFDLFFYFGNNFSCGSYMIISEEIKNVKTNETGRCTGCSVQLS